MRQTEEIKFPLSVRGIILSLIFFPIGILVLFFATIVYLARWMCYNLGMPNIFCYLIALILAPIFFPLLLLSFIFKALTGGFKEERKPSKKSPSKKSPSKKSPSKKSPSKKSPSKKSPSKKK